MLLRRRRWPPGASESISKASAAAAAVPFDCEAQAEPEAADDSVRLRRRLSCALGDSVGKAVDSKREVDMGADKGGCCMSGAGKDMVNLKAPCGCGEVRRDPRRVSERRSDGLEDCARALG
jgi:hypothetical protein